MWNIFFLSFFFFNKFKSSLQKQSLNIKVESHTPNKKKKKKSHKQDNILRRKLVIIKENILKNFKERKWN